MNALFALIGGFASGVFLRSLFVFGWPVYAFVGILLLLCAGAVVLTPRPENKLGAIFFLFLIFGAVRVPLGDAKLPSVFAADLKHRVSYEAVVTGDPDLREKNQRIPVRLTNGGASVGALAVMPLSQKVSVGDRVRVSGTLELPQAFADDNGRIFRYDKYLEARDIRFLVSFGSIRVESHAPWYSVAAALARVKHAFLTGLARALPSTEAALAGGIVIGGKSSLGTDLQDAFTRAGLVQIVVLSGYNVMIVAEWAMVLASYLAWGRRGSAAAGAAALLLLIGIAGISATAIRAALMALIALYARATGRSYSAGRALLVAIFLMLLSNPLYLAFDPGFGLSVAATAGLIWLAPLIENRLAKIPLAPLRNALATTLAAQIAVLPLLLYDMGLFSFIAIPANLVVNPLIPLAMAFSALAGLGGMVFGTAAPLLAHIIGFPAHLFMTAIIFIAQKSAKLPFAAVSVAAFPFTLVLFAYAALALVTFAKRSSMTFQFTLFKKAST